MVSVIVIILTLVAVALFSGVVTRRRRRSATVHRALVRLGSRSLRRRMAIVVLADVGNASLEAFRVVPVDVGLVFGVVGGLLIQEVVHKVVPRGFLADIVFIAGQTN